MDDKIYAPDVIPDQAFPSQTTPTAITVAQSTNPTQPVSPAVTPDNSMPIQRPPHELLASALNTRSKKIIHELQFTPSGALQIGDYTQGVNGDIRISPDGIVARNDLGDTTFAIDGDTGDAFFSGEIQAGTVISGEVIVGDNRIIIDGENKTIIINDGKNDRVLIGFQAGGF